MEIDSLKQFRDKTSKKIDIIYAALKIDEKKENLKKLEETSCTQNFYSREDSAHILQKMKEISYEVQKIEKLKEKLNDLSCYIELISECMDEESIKEAEKLSKYLEEKVEALEIDTLLSEDYDKNNAIISIHPGAGGTESQDWADMLYRMYVKWAAKTDFELEVLDIEQAEDAGVKSVSFAIRGVNAYGYLKSEHGVHRLVRISPFDANSRRHTSFAAVEVLPEVSEDVDLNIRQEDIEMDVYRASGAGGQHVNKTSSAVRLKHVPTGIVVSCQTERSQLQNRENAMKMLKAKLYLMKIQEHKKEMEKIKGKVVDNAWGSQIRSYVFCPYTLVKDHRTSYEVGNVQAVMDGRIDEFIYSYLKYCKNNGIIN